MTVFDEALAYLINVDESARYVDDPNDSGGPTKFGITLKAYSNYLGKPVMAEEIASLTVEQVGPFYMKMYWKPLSCDRMTDPAIATAIFDCGVLYGVVPAATLAQQAVSNCVFGHVIIDGVIGNKSVTFLNRVKRKLFLTALKNAVLRRIQNVIDSNPKDEKYRQGWINRAERLLTLNTDPAFNKPTA